MKLLWFTFPKKTGTARKTKSVKAQASKDSQKLYNVLLSNSVLLTTFGIPMVILDA